MVDLIYSIIKCGFENHIYKKYKNVLQAERNTSMRSIILVAESGSDITPELAKRYNITVVPMHVAFDTQVLNDI